MTSLVRSCVHWLGCLCIKPGTVNWRRFLLLLIFFLRSPVGLRNRGQDKLRTFGKTGIIVSFSYVPAFFDEDAGC